MNVIIVEPNKDPRVIEIGDTVKDLEKAVGGRLMFKVHHDQPVLIIYNVQAKPLGLPPNRPTFGDEYDLDDVIYGTFIIVGMAKPEDECGPDDGFMDLITSVPEYAIEGLLEVFRKPDLYVPMKGEVIPVNTGVIKCISENKEKWMKETE